MRNKSLVTYSLVLFILFLALAVSYELPVLQSIDVYIMENVPSLHTSWMTEAMLFLAWLGSVNVVAAMTVVLSIILVIRKRSVYAAFFPAIAMIGTGILNTTYKQLINRERPDWLPLYDPSGYSFPSGHTMAIVSFCGVCIYLSMMYVKSRSKRLIVLILMVTISIFMGFSRIYLGVHFFTDIVGGVLLSISWLCLGIFLTNKFIAREKEVKMSVQ